MREKLKRLLSLLRGEIGAREVLTFGGLAAFAYGLHQVYPPAAWMAVGLILMAAARPRRSD